MRIGLTFNDGQLSAHRYFELMGQELLFIRNSLSTKGYDAEIFVTDTKSSMNTKVINNSDELNKYDILIIFNTTLNQYGGILNISQFNLHRYLHDYKGLIFYWYEDINFVLRNLKDEICNKSWWKDNPLCDDNDLTLPSIYILSMFSDNELVKKVHSKIDIVNIYNVPVYRLHIDDRSFSQPLFGKTVDLIYGGGSRHGKRNKFYQEYFIDLSDEFSVELYGKIQNDLVGIDLKNCLFSKTVPYKDVLTKNATALATVIPSEKYYNNNCITPRIAEALMSDTICFIEDKFDESHKIFSNEFFYVSSGEELKQKLMKIKSNIDFYNSLLEYQRSILKKWSRIDLGDILDNIIQEVV